MESRVVFPLPEGPTIATTSRSCTAASIPDTARTSALPLLKTFETDSRTSGIGFAAVGGVNA